MALVALGLLVSLSVSAQASHRDHGYSLSHDYNYPIYRDHGYRGHLAYRDHGYDRFDYDWYPEQHSRRFRPHGDRTDIWLSFGGGDHWYRNGHSRRRGHR